MCYEEFAVRQNSLIVMPVDTVTCWRAVINMWFGEHIVAHKCWLINGDVNMMQGTYNIKMILL